MAKINKIFKVDAWLLPVFLGLAVTGVKLHVAGENAPHEVWHNWAVAHIVFSAAFLVLIYMHIRMHWGWYRSLVKTRMKGRGVTVFLSLLFLLETISGISLLLFIDGADSGWGHFHWIVGILLTLFGLGHLVKRWPRLKRGLGFQ